MTRIAVCCLGLVMMLPGARGQESAPTANATAGAAPTALQKKIEAYLRNLYALGPDTSVAVGPFSDTGLPGLQQTNVVVTVADNAQTVKFFASKDGRYLLQGEISDMSKDPLAENRSKLDLKDAPSMGDAKAPITLVEFSDFECPVCRNLHEALRSMLPSYPQVRVVFKDYPIEQLHPWARTAAIAGRCAYQQDPKAFWKMYDLIYDHQDVISAENSYGKMTDYAGQIGLNQEAFSACQASPEPGAAIDASRENGKALEVTSTPTLFVNGRRIVGADPHALEQYFKYELEQTKSGKANAKN